MKNSKRLEKLSLNKTTVSILNAKHLIQIKGGNHQIEEQQEENAENANNSRKIHQKMKQLIMT